MAYWPGMPPSAAESDKLRQLLMLLSNSGVDNDISGLAPVQPVSPPTPVVQAPPTPVVQDPSTPVVQVPPQAVVQNPQLGVTQNPLPPEVADASDQGVGWMDRFMTNMNKPSTRFLLGMGSSMLANSGPSTTPRSSGQIIGQGLVHGLSATDEARREDLSAKKMEALLKKDEFEYKIDKNGNVVRIRRSTGDMDFTRNPLGVTKKDIKPLRIGKNQQLIDPETMEPIATGPGFNRKDPQRPYTLGENSQLIDPVTGSVIATGPGFGKDPNKTPNEIELIQRSLMGDKEATRILDELTNRRRNLAQATAQGRAAGDPDTTDHLSEEAVDQIAQKYVMTGKMPGLGMGKSATAARSRVLNRVAQLAVSPADMATKEAMYRASTNELSQLQGQRGKIMAFVNTTEKNLAVVESMSQQVHRTGVPMLNAWINAGKRAITGDPDLAAYDGAIRTAINEYAKVISSATGGGVTSDTARKEVEEMLNSAMTADQVASVLSLLRTEMGNRATGYDDQIKVITDTIRGLEGSGIKPKPVEDTSKRVGGSRPTVDPEAAKAELRRRGFKIP